MIRLSKKLSIQKLNLLISIHYFLKKSMSLTYQVTNYKSKKLDHNKSKKLFKAIEQALKKPA